MKTTLEKHIAPVLVSVGLHALVIFFLLVGWAPAPEPVEIKRPNFVQAKLVKLEDQTKRNVPKPEKPQVVDLEKKRKEQERQKQLAEQKKQQEIKRKQEEAKKQKAEAERKKKEQDRKAKEEAERKVQAEQQKKQIEQERKQEELRKQKEQQAFEQALAQEEMRLAEESYAVTAQSYMSAISQRIEQNWSRPPSARNDMQCELRIQLVPTGRVVNVDVTKSSGNSLFDLSAVQAVKKAEQFPEIKEMPPEVFERYYRELKLIFRPQDLRQ